ncbi:hypothetical protein HYW35_02875 [Candidatus Saccharibacteria bacterium]|nr:hypothetical protein [Candidatus Saccharibacteria bacterium]
METLVSSEIQRQREQEFRYDLKTQFAELVDGNMRTDFELRFNGYDLIGEDGRGMDEVTKKSLDEAEKIAELNPNLRFEKRRRGLERYEFHELVEMAQGKGPNTMIVVSDFPPELLSAEEDVGGYNVRRQQTMLRVLSRAPDGHMISISSQSLDGSNRQGMEAIYAYFGIEPEAGELLGQRIRADLTEQDQAFLTDKLTGIYDQSLTAQFGGQWYAGRRPTDYRNTYDFVCQQHDLIEECVRLQSLGWFNDTMMYKMSATMQKRFKAHQEGTTDIMPRLTTTELAVLHRELEIDGFRAYQMGMSFSACGVTLRSNGLLDGSIESQLRLAGYGNQASEEDCEFVSKECPGCHAKNVKTRVTKTGSGRRISGSCGCTKIIHD